MSESLDLDLWPDEPHHPFGNGTEDYCPRCFGQQGHGGPSCGEGECMCPCSDPRPAA